ncbi:hypothetical protein PFISCL1PPCAC_14890 [Pristionchus fissidentatus]|uniref:Centromere protein X n=1 Tax=Pristionchus fissidentatus TaxID=1538716 RepID=A0AAV5VZE7_9BILA|nr:hypothetical protein PFISCL1PPCAC_14890 [Pristionchus fissidentatus]
MAKSESKLKPALVRGLLNNQRMKKGGTQSPINLSAKTLPIVTALAEKLMRESIRRSIELCRQSGETKVSLEHFQRILAQLMLDFSV